MPTEEVVVVEKVVEVEATPEQPIVDEEKENLRNEVETLKKEIEELKKVPKPTQKELDAQMTLAIEKVIASRPEPAKPIKWVK